jgi:lysozyme
MSGANKPLLTEPSQAANPPTRHTLSTDGLQFIQRHEGYSDRIYKDRAGYPTIGYGHLIRSGEDFTNGVTQAHAIQLLSQDTQTAVDSVNNKVKVNLSQTQFDALVDFTYNLGGNNFGQSTLLKNVNGGNPVILQNFTDWNHAGGKVVPGLTKRRTDEFNLYTQGNYGS